MRKTNYKSDKWKSRAIFKTEIQELLVNQDFSKKELIEIRDFIKQTKQNGD